MRRKSRTVPSILLSALAFIGTIGIVTPNCFGWFYEPQRPKEL
ncbi:MAG: cyclic lactone autoinducer peptide [Peptococcaceae bacterium]|nr:cyclic lactone autoinducer peptide [Peptococcaceae bacterium]